MDREIRFNAFDMNTPAHQSMGLWRHPRDRSHEYNSIAYWQEVARTLERGLFDGIFIADVTGLYDVYGGTPDTAIQSAVQIPTNDPFTLVPVMAAVTEHLSFGVTGAIPYLHPYSFARLISSLDHLTQGRIGWNVVTGYLDSAAKGSGQVRQVSHDTRYEIADEFMTVTYKLWEGSWEDGAVLRDAERGVYTDPSRVHSVKHVGEYFELEAIHLCEPSPQRSPVIYQAGASPRGRRFAGKHAECVFVADGNPKVVADQIQGLCDDLQAVGRSREDVRIFGLMSLVVAESDREAEAKFNEYQSYGLHEGALALISGWTGINLAELDLDARAENLESEAIQTATKALGARTVRDWAEYLVVGGAAPVLVGSPKTVADGLEDWMERTGVDGFNLAYTVLPECLDDLVDLVVPELQRRGRYKTSYAEGTMRDKLFGKGPRLESPHPGAAFRV